MIVALCGPPAAGKTTLATGLRERLAGRGHEFEILHSDDFSRRTYERMYERVAGTDADWILDGTFYAREWQERFRALGEVRLVWVRASVETALARNRAREEPIPESGVYAMYARFDEPRADLALDTDERSTREALDRLETVALSWLGDDPDATVL